MKALASTFAACPGRGRLNAVPSAQGAALHTLRGTAGIIYRAAIWMKLDESSPDTARGRDVPERPDHHRPRFADRQSPGFATAGGIRGCLSGLGDKQGQQPSPDSSAGVGVMRCTA